MSKKLRTNRWKIKHDATLRRMLKQGNTTAEVAVVLGRTTAAVRTRKYTLGIKTGNPGRPAGRLNKVTASPATPPKPKTIESTKPTKASPGIQMEWKDFKKAYKASKKAGVPFQLTIQ